MAIPDIMSIAKASKTLDRNPHFVKGMAFGLGVRVRKVGRSLALAARDVERIREEAARREAELDSQ